MYGLNKDDMREVETWYARRYPSLPASPIFEIAFVEGKVYTAYLRVK